MFIRAPIFMRKVIMGTLGFANHLAIFACLKSYEKWVAHKKTTIHDPLILTPKSRGECF